MKNVIIERMALSVEISNLMFNCSTKSIAPMK